jgi:hypothetical protein
LHRHLWCGPRDRLDHRRLRVLRAAPWFHPVGFGPAPFLIVVNQRSREGAARDE